MLIVSVLAVVYDFWAAVGDMAHNQYQGRHDLLDTSRPQPEHLSPHLGLTAKELASCDPYFASVVMSRQFTMDTNWGLGILGGSDGILPSPVFFL